MADRIEGVKKLFTSKSARVETNRGDAHYEKLFQSCQTRIEELKTQTPSKNRLNIDDLLQDQGINRRDFMKWASAVTGMLMLPASFTPLVADAALLMNRAPVIWIELSDCAGNTEAMLR
jgi:quinone-reactive Ni/Fe-hydrogenase small subunit